MSTDEDVTKQLIETLEDGHDGYAKGAEKLGESDSPEYAAKFREFSQQRLHMPSYRAIRDATAARNSWKFAKILDAMVFLSSPQPACSFR